MATTPATLAPVVSIIDGKPVTTSTDIADHFHKRHDTVLRAVRNLDCTPEFSQRNFAERKKEYSTGKGQRRESVYFEITRDGFVFLAMGFTGPAAAKWKEAYINAFNAMERELSSKTGEFITPAQQNTLQQAIKLKAGDDGRKLAGLWSRFNNHFKLGSYKQLPSSRFEEALLYAIALPGALPKPEAAPALPAPVVVPPPALDALQLAMQVMRGTKVADSNTRIDLANELLQNAIRDTRKSLHQLEVASDLVYSAKHADFNPVKAEPYQF